MKSNREEIIDILKHCNSVHTIDCKTTLLKPLKKLDF